MVRVCRYAHCAGAAVTRTFDLTDLRDDGDTIELVDGRTLRLRIEVDQDTSISDYECYGEIAPAKVWDRDGMRATRPRDFTGNAEKLWTCESGSECFWWEPPKDGPKRTEPSFAAFRQQVRELVTWGFKGVILERLDGEDAYGRPIVTQTASLWGIDSLENGYLAEVVRDLADELHLTRDGGS